MNMEQVEARLKRLEDVVNVKDASVNIYWGSYDTNFIFCFRYEGRAVQIEVDPIQLEKLRSGKMTVLTKDSLTDKGGD